jgi:uncharacterized protein (UPF0332 family)
MDGEQHAVGRAAELDRADRALMDARLLLGTGSTLGAVGRAYYSAFHAVRAILRSVGLEARTRQDTLSLLRQHFVHSGRLHPGQARLVAQLQADREDAEYSLYPSLTAEHAAEDIEKASRFLKEARRICAEADAP